MTKMLRMTATTLILLATMTACDRAGRNSLRAEREDRLYRAAMDDYAAGRIDVAIKGLEKTVRNNPANANARFQLACLLQDARKDHLGAYCGYREYLLRNPDADKAGVAKERLDRCEAEVAKALAEKYGLMKAETFAAELEAVRAELKDVKAKMDRQAKELDEAHVRAQALSDERQRLIAMIKGDDDESTSPQATLRTKEVKDLLDESDDGDRVVLSDDIAALRNEEKDELSATSTILPERKEGDVAARRDASDRKDEPEKKAKAPERPETYVVQEGDTLYRIATRFYGTMHAWKRIREANKALISSDGRLRAGDTIKLP